MKPPLKGTGAPGSTPSSRPTRKLEQSYGACTHITTLIVPTLGYVHYGHEVCAACGRHVRWIPKPATLERRRLTAFRLAKLPMCSSLSPWERTFIRSVSEQRKLSPKQLVLIDRIAAQHLEAAS